MKIVHITPGSGGVFYCQNCFRDSELIKALIELGNDVHNVPIYLPINNNDHDINVDTPVFYGAINVYLKEKIPLYRKAPGWLERIFDSDTMLNYAAKKSASTEAVGLEEMTISMLKGEEGRQASELDHLIKYLSKEVKPDIVHLSNALLLGLAKRLKYDLGAKVVCSLQDENEWIDLMDEEYQVKVWNLMAERAVDVSLFVTSSQFYAEKSKTQLKLPAKKIKVVYGGINLDGYKESSLPFDPPVIGYLCRMSKDFGLDILVDAFIRLKNETPNKKLQLFINGGYSDIDKPFVKKQLDKISANGFGDDVKIFDKFDKANRIEFLKSLTLLSVPVPKGEAFGTYQIEALAAGVPIVQPNVGCYPEFIEATKGGIIFEPNDGEHLAKAIASLLNDPDKVRKMSKHGMEVIKQKFIVQNMAKEMLKSYESILG